MADDIIEISEQWEGDVAATAAELSVQVHGAQLFGGEVALEKAEVAALREALVGVGLPAEAVSLAGLHAEVETGLFSRSSSARYTLSVRIDDLALLAAALDVVMGAKQAQLLGIRWIYEPSEEVVGRWLARCAGRARHAAESLAAALGAAALSPRELAEAFAAVMVELHEDDPPLHRVLTEEVPLLPAMQAWVRALEEAMVEALAALIAGDPGLAHPRPRVAARMVAGLLESATHRWATDAEGAPLPREVLIAELAAMITAYLTAR